MRLTTSLVIIATLSVAAIDSVSAYSKSTMLCLVNKERSRRGLPALGPDGRLDSAAQRHSSDQARHRRMTHNGSDGSSPSKRISRAGYNWNSCGENVAYGYNNEATCMHEWMESPGHRANILGRQYTHLGSAVAYSGSTPYYTQSFGGDGRRHRFPVCGGGGYKPKRRYHRD
jgi:uncharacterized protein YkwD